MHTPRVQVTDATPFAVDTSALARARWLLMGLFALNGLLCSSWLARIPAVRDAPGATAARLGVPLMVQFAATAIVGTVWRLASIRGAVLESRPAVAVRLLSADMTGDGTTGPAVPRGSVRTRGAFGAWSEPRTLLIGVVIMAAALAAPRLLGLVAESVGARHALLLITVAMVASVSVARVVARPVAGALPRRPGAATASDERPPERLLGPSALDPVCPGAVVSERVAAC